MTNLKNVANLDKLIIELVLNINKGLDIPDIQKRFGYPGGSLIRLNIMDGAMEKIITQSDWMVDEGKLKVVVGAYSVDAQIDVTLEAIKWAILGRAMSDGHMYTFMDALRLDHMRVYGERSMVRAAYFMHHVFPEISKNEGAMSGVRPLLEIL